MILKIKQNWHSRGRVHGEGEIVPQKVLECDRYDMRAYNEVDSKAEAAEAMFCDEDGQVNLTLTLITFKKGKFADMLLLGNATVFVMNNEGKTVDTIYT